MSDFAVCGNIEESSSESQYDAHTYSNYNTAIRQDGRSLKREGCMIKED